MSLLLIKISLLLLYQWTIAILQQPPVIKSVHDTCTLGDPFTALRGKQRYYLNVSPRAGNNQNCTKENNHGTCKYGLCHTILTSPQHNFG